MTLEFKPWPKTPRLSNASMVITEKIDGTNACVIVTEEGHVAAQSRNRLITPADDNYGFAKWVWDNQQELVNDLGPGYHYGEWWGSGIQHGYGLPNGDKRFSLFNTGRWKEPEAFTTPQLGVVPVLLQYQLDLIKIHEVVEELRVGGSVAAPGQKAEGVIVYIPIAKQTFKVLIENDDKPKSLALAA